MPVGLRNDGNLVALCFKDAPDDRCTKRGVVYIGIAREEDNIQLLPTSQFTLFLCGWEKICKSIFFQCLRV